MKKKLSYLEWSQWFADQCDVCNGSQIVLVNGSPRRCRCQLIATAKARLEAVDIVPANLKYCNWSDFTGLIKNSGEIQGTLTTGSAIQGRNSAFRYCFGENYNLTISRNPANIRLNDRIVDGNNLVIVGPENSGKTLLAVLVLKEACNAYIVGKNIQFKWVKFYDLLNHARWDTGKDINHVLLDELSELDLLFIDGIDDYHGGHNSPPDHTSMNVLFGTRRILNLPTIFVCSLSFSKQLKSQGLGKEGPVIKFGEEFVRSITDKSSTFIELKKS